jgi:hypothetical protein
MPVTDRNLGTRFLPHPPSSVAHTAPLPVATTPQNLTPCPCCVALQEGPAPIPRDSHVSVIHKKSMYVFGGSTGNAMDDLHELNLDTYKWAPVTPAGGYDHHHHHHACTPNLE